MTHRAPLTVRTWPYRTGRFDGSYEEIAGTYGLHYGDLEANNSWLSHDQASVHPVLENVTVQIPIRPDALDYEWERYPVPAGQTLEEVCRIRNQTAGRGAAITTAGREAQTPERPLRRTAPELTPQYLWTLVLNCDFRRQYLEETFPQADVSADVATSELPRVRLRTASYLMIPWPGRALGRPIHVAPGPGPRAAGTYGPTGDAAACTQCAAVPDWVDELYVDHIVPMGAAVERLLGMNREYRRRFDLLMRDLGHLQVVELLVRGMRRETMSRPVERVLEPLARLSEEFADALSRPAGLSGVPARRRVEWFVYGHPHTDREMIAHDLLRRLQRPRFNELCETAFREEDMVVNETETVRSRICGLVADLCAQVLLVASVEQEMAAVIERALQTHGTTPRRGVVQPQRGRDALETLMSLGASDVGIPSHPLRSAIGAAAGLGSIGTTLVGNLPGPPSLAGALMQLGLTRDVQHLGAAIGSGARAEAQAAATLRIQQLATYSQLPEAELRRDLAAVQTEADAQRLADRVAGRYQSSRGWCSALAIVNLIGLINTAANPPTDPFSEHPGVWAIWIGSLTISGANTVSACAGMLVRFGEAGRWQSCAEALGYLGAVIAIFSGLATAYMNWGRDTAQVIIGFAQAAGGTLLLFGGPWAIAGAVILTGTSIVQAILSGTDGAPESRRCVLTLLAACRELPRVARVLDGVPALRSRYQAFERLVRDSDAFVPVFENQYNPLFPRHTSNARTFLQGQHVANSVIDAFITPA